MQRWHSSILLWCTLTGPAPTGAFSWPRRASAVASIHAVCLAVSAIRACVSASLQRRIGWISLDQRKDHRSRAYRTTGSRHRHQSLLRSHRGPFLKLDHPDSPHPPLTSVHPLHLPRLDPRRDEIVEPGMPRTPAQAMWAASRRRRGSVAGLNQSRAPSSDALPIKVREKHKTGEG
jgi:hypothetical protein